MTEQAGVVMRKRAPSNVDALRFGYDERLAAKIFAAFGQPAIGAAPKTTELLDMRRRHLLGDAVLITAELIPDVARAFAQCLRALGLSGHAGGLYVQQCAEYNASVLSDGERFDIVVNSALLRDFSIPELRFVIGHELGHVLFNHNEISLRGLFEAHEDIAEEDAMMLFRWSRSAEISADRVGLVCAGGAEPAVSAMFKISSGISGIPIDAVRSAMRHQFEQLKLHIHDTNVDDYTDLVRTHPMSPIRFRSMELAVKHIAAIFRGDVQGEKPASLETLDENIEALLQALESDGPAARGFYASAGQEILCLVLIYVALSNGVIAMNHRTFIQTVFMAIRSELALDNVLRRIGRDWKGFRARALDRIYRAVDEEVLTHEEHCRMLSLASIMVSGGNAIAVFQIALADLAQCFQVEIRSLPRVPLSQGISHDLIREVLDIRSARITDE